MSLNSVVITGFVSRAPVLSKTAKGRPCLVFGLGWSSAKSDDCGGWYSSLNFIDCILYDKAANYYFGRLFKGTRVSVVGELIQNNLAKSPSRGFQIQVKSLERGSMIEKFQNSGGR